MRIQSLIAVGVASIVVVALGAIAFIAGRLGMDPQGATREVRVALATKPLERGCADCGVVTAVKEVQLKGKGKDRRPALQYQIRVRMSDGSVKILTTDTAPAWKAGDRVRLQNGRLAG